MYNLEFRWRYVLVLAELGNKADFRQASTDTEVRTVLAALPCIVVWISAHPE